MPPVTSVFEIRSAILTHNEHGDLGIGSGYIHRVLQSLFISPHQPHSPSQGHGSSIQVQ